MRRLLAARFVQGLAGAACWTAAMIWLLEVAPLERRGVLLGVAFGVSEAGAIAGPAAGGVAAGVGRAPTFIAVAALCLLLALVTTRFSAPPKPAQRRLGLGSALSAASIRKAMWIALLPAIVLAAISVLAPLQQHRLGAGPGEIAATFGVAAILVVVALILIGVLWAPVMVMLSDACAAAGVGQIMAVAMMDLTWPPGNIVGSAGGAAIAQSAGQRLAYATMAASLLAGYLALSRRSATTPEAAVAERLHIPRT